MFVAGIGALLALLVGSLLLVNQLSSTKGAPPPNSPALAPAGDSASGGQGQTVDGIPCQGGEMLAFHIHAHLAVLKDGVQQKVPESIGIPGSCIYWLHTHDDTGLIHMEAPAPQTFTLGQFFDIWGYPLQPGKVATITVPPGGLHVFVNGSAYDGDMRAIKLERHTEVVIEVGRQVSPPTFDFGLS